MEYYFVNLSCEYLFNILNIMVIGFNLFVIDEICIGVKFYLFLLWSLLVMYV